MEQYDANDLVLFAYLAEAKSFTKTAEKIGIPKATLSRRIALLEEKLGERLLQRTTRTLTITEFGYQLLEHANQVQAEVNAVKMLSESRQARPSGTLRISMPSDFAHLLLGDMLAAFSALHPAVSIELDLSPRRIDLISENYDLAIRLGELQDDTTLIARKLAEFPISLYASPDYLADNGTPTTPDELLLHRGLLLSVRNGETPVWTLRNGLQQWNGLPKGVITANSPELLLKLSIARAGIAAIPDHFANQALLQNKLRKVLPSWRLPPHIAWAIWPGRRLMPLKTRAFIDMLVTVLSPP